MPLLTPDVVPGWAVPLAKLALKFNKPSLTAAQPEL